MCLKREINLTLKTCAPDFSARFMTKLYAKIKGARTISLLDFLKTWQVCLIILQFSMPRWLSSSVTKNSTKQEIDY